jgi:hypothetical protein
MRYACTPQVEKIIPKAGQPEYKFFLFTHIDFEIKYNGDRVIEINVLTDPNQAVDISENTKDVKVLRAGAADAVVAAGVVAKASGANGQYRRTACLVAAI